MKAKNLISAGWRIVSRHPGYIFWFWLLNLTLAEFGTAIFRARLHAVLDHSLLADRLLHGFDGAVYHEMINSPDWGSFRGSATPAAYFAFLFFLITLFCLPGVLDAYTSEGRPSREDFFRCCGRNLWRFVRVLVLYAFVAGVLGGALFGAHVDLVHASRESTNELLPFYTTVVTLAAMFLVLTAVRIWFDLAQVDVVFQDQGTVRKSIAAALRATRGRLLALMSAYIALDLLCLVVLAAGIWLGHELVPPGKILPVFLIAQAALIVSLLTRFWQRAVAAAFYLHETEQHALVGASYEPASPVGPGSRVHSCPS